MKKTSLGRGLDALLPKVDLDSPFMMVSVFDIDPNPHQPRRDFDGASLEELAESIREVGVLQPILLIQKGERYQIVAGERRFRAARLAGLDEIPALVRAYEGAEAAAAALIENLQREDLNAMEAASGIERLMGEHKLTQEAVAKVLGKARSTVTNTLRLLTLTDEVKQLVRDGLLSAGHARALVAVDAQRQVALAKRAVEQGLSVRQIEDLIKAAPKAKPAPKKARAVPTEITAFEEKMHEAFGVKARVVGSLTKGKITLSYHSQEELEYIYSRVDQIT